MTEIRAASGQKGGSSAARHTRVREQFSCFLLAHSSQVTASGTNLGAARQDFTAPDKTHTSRKHAHTRRQGGDLLTLFLTYEKAERCRTS